MTFALYPLIVAVIGVLMYAFCSDKPADIGRILFAIGALWLIYSMAGKSIHL